MTQGKPAMSPSDVPVSTVLDKLSVNRRTEAERLVPVFREVTGEEPVVWAGRILGFGLREYRYDSGRSGIMPVLSFAPGAARHTVYLASDFDTRWPDVVNRLGRHKTGRACLYLPGLAGADLETLRELLVLTRDSFARSAETG